MKKPSASAIRAAIPLSELHPADGPVACSICGHASEHLSVWREHDERDKPKIGLGALVFLGEDHVGCRNRLDEHPRLYAEETGDPGHFPLLCGGCAYRDHMGCRHPKLGRNGGPGLRVELSGFGAGAIICTRGGGCHRPLARATRCEGRKERDA